LWHIYYTMEENYFVYKHIREDKGNIFYIGIGKIRSDKSATTFKMKHYRAYSKQGRNPIWKRIVEKTNYKVEIVITGISFKKAKNLEIELISKYGKIKEKGLLANLSDGGETVSQDLITVLNDPKCSERVYQYDLDGNFIKEWLSTNQIKRELGFDNSVIRKALKSNTKSPNISYKFQWFLEYKGEKIPKSDSGKITLHKGVILENEKEKLTFNSRQECAEYFNVQSAQISNVIKNNWNFKGYKIKNNGI
jgi:hypothetical protein